MSIVRFFMLLSLVAWLGGILFFAFVVAPGVFAVLPTRQLAGQVVSHSLARLHWIGLVSGLVFLLTSIISARASTGSAHLFAVRNLFVVLMILLTLVSQFAISGKMLALRNDMKMIDEVAATDPRRIEFNRLHHWSTRLEATVLVLGLLTLYLTARRLT